MAARGLDLFPNILAQSVSQRQQPEASSQQAVATSRQIQYLPDTDTQNCESVADVAASLLPAPCSVHLLPNPNARIAAVLAPRPLRHFETI